jgi:hypothetical protein
MPYRVRRSPGKGNWVKVRNILSTWKLEFDCERKSSFLKKRSKKLLPVLASAFPDRLGQNEQKFFGSFFQKRTASFTWKIFGYPRRRGKAVLF